MFVQAMNGRHVCETQFKLCLGTNYVTEKHHLSCIQASKCHTANVYALKCLRLTPASGQVGSQVSSGRPPLKMVHAYPRTIPYVALPALPMHYLPCHALPPHADTIAPMTSPSGCPPICYLSCHAHASISGNPLPIQICLHNIEKPGMF